jgi:hypothetical protein
MLLGTLLTLVIWGGVAFGWWSGRSPLGINAGLWGLLVNYTICIGGGLLMPAAEPADDQSTVGAGGGLGS